MSKSRLDEMLEVGAELKSKIITFRCPPTLDAALSAIAKSDGVPLGDVIRQRLGASVGIDAGALPVGLAGASPETRAEVSRDGHAGKESAKRKTKGVGDLRRTRKKSQKK